MLCRWLFIIFQLFGVGVVVGQNSLDAYKNIDEVMKYNPIPPLVISVSPSLNLNSQGSLSLKPICYQCVPLFQEGNDVRFLLFMRQSFSLKPAMVYEETKMILPKTSSKVELNVKVELPNPFYETLSTLMTSPLVKDLLFK